MYVLTQVVKFADAIPENYRSYSYAGATIGGGILIALATYAWSVWAY